MILPRRAGFPAHVLVALSMALGMNGAFAPVSSHAAPAPTFKARDLSGRVIDVAQLRRQGPVLLDFWATWCKPCLEAIPELQDLHTRFGPRGLTVIGISVDGPRNQARIRPFVNRLGITYPIVLDDDERLRHLYQVVAMPTALLIDADGNVESVRVGYRPGEGEALEKSILALLSGSHARDSAAVRAAPDSATGESPP